MSQDNWIDISAYAAKYGISISTLRRRIRSGSIAHRLNKGRYLLPDSGHAMAEAPLFSRMSLQQSSTTSSEDVFDPVEAFMKNNSVLPIHFSDELNNLRTQNKSLHAQVAELETYVRALEAQLQQKP
jgi:hypothetical protein